MATADHPDPVASPQNRRVAEAIKLHRRRGRRAAGLALLEGPNAVGEAVAAGVAVARVFHLPDDEEGRAAAIRVGSEAIAVTPEVLGRLSTTQTPQSPVAVVVVPAPLIPETGDLIVSWGVGDPGNVGTLIRTAAAFGMGFVAGPGTADPWSPKVLRAAAGAHFNTPLGVATGPGDLGGRVLVATVARDGRPPSDLPAGPLAILVGGEAAGLPADISAAADVRISIPMPGGTESLNAAIAGAIVGYTAAMRGDTGPGTPAH